MPAFSSASFEFYLAGGAISLFHAVLPSHWLPFILLGRAERWSRKKVLGVLLASGGAHVAITGALGFGAAAFGKVLSNAIDIVPVWLAGVILVAWGAGYLLVPGAHSHADDPEETARRLLTRDRMAALSLFLTLTLSPCEAIVPVFFAASRLGWAALAGLVALMAAATLGGMVLLAVGFSKGMERLRWQWLECHESKVIGSVLVLLGFLILWYPQLH